MTTLFYTMFAMGLLFVGLACALLVAICFINQICVVFQAMKSEFLK